MESANHSAKLNDTIVRLNVKRVELVAALAVLIQLANLADGTVFSDHARFVGALALAGCSLLYLIAVFFVQKKHMAFGPRMAWLCRGYMVILAVCMLPFLFADVRTGTLTNVALFAGVLLYAPAFSVRENPPLFLAGALYMPIAAWAMGAGIGYILRAAGICAAGVLLSYSLHSGYLDVIQSLRMESDLDDLTKLYNRKAGLLRMESLLALCKRMNRMVAAYYIDIDFFKSYNDTYGHLAGDHALMDAAACIRRCFARETDVLCRMGGDEFAVLIPVTKEGAALLMAQRLIRMVSDMNIQAGADAGYFVVTASIGVALFTDSSSLQTPVQALIDEADRQLYIAKSEGRNCIAMGDAVVYRNEWV